MRSVALAACALLPILGQVACAADNTPCSTDCPPLEGEWTLTLSGGSASLDDEDCAALGVSAPDGGTLSILRQTADLQATFADVRFHGVAYDTFDFRLTALGDAGADVTQLRGRYLVTGSTGSTGAPDAGAGRLQGTWSRTARETPQLGTPRTCTLQRSFTAERQ